MVGGRQGGQVTFPHKMRLTVLLLRKGTMRLLVFATVHSPRPKPYQIPCKGQNQNSSHLRAGMGCSFFAFGDLRLCQLPSRRLMWSVNYVENMHVQMCIIKAVCGFLSFFGTCLLIPLSMNFLQHPHWTLRSATVAGEQVL